MNLGEEHFGNKYGHLLDHLQHFEEKTGGSLQGKDCLELGTGWYPVIPIGYFLNGAKRICSVDISSLTTSESLLICITEILKRESIFFKQMPHLDKSRWAVLKEIQANCSPLTPLDEICRMIHLEILVQDARQLDFNDNSFDFVSSNNTFEHIFADILAGILPELWRVTKTDGLMSHFIDLSDHFAHMDGAITIYNFLQFSEKAWQRIDNDIQPQNRWRWKQYLALYEQLNIPAISKRIRPGNLEEVRSLSLAFPFSEMTEEEVAISHGYVLSGKE